MSGIDREGKMNSEERGVDMVNVIAVIEVGHWEHSQRHWFWCLWVNQAGLDEPSHEPLAFGFSESADDAEQAPWRLLEKYSKPGQPRSASFRRDWGQAYLENSPSARAELERLRDEVRAIYQRPVFGRCSIGKGRWYWSVGCEYDFDANRYTTPIAEGIAESSEAAFRQADVTCGPLRMGHSWVVRNYRKQLAAERRMQKTTDSTKSLKNEFVFECNGGFQTAHRIVKKTAKYIYVEHDPAFYSPTNDWHDYSRRTFQLNRRQLEEHGKAERRGRRYETYYSSPEIYLAERRVTSLPKCFTDLGMKEIGTLKDVKRAYKRLVKTCHPDAGGDPEEFKRIRIGI
jgi:hypothetical protein